MTPTPAPHSTFQNFRFRRRPNTTPFQRDVTPVPTPATPVTPLVDQDDDQEMESRENEEEGQSGEEDEDSDIEEEVAEGEDEEEGGIEEGHNPTLINAMPPLRLPIYSLSPDLQGPEGLLYPVPMEIDIPFDPSSLGLKEIGNLASWTVSSCKPGCGVEALRDDDTALFWQSDGPQPHHLNIHFSRLVLIRAIRIFLDFEADESYTPTRITLYAGTGYHDLIPFSALSFEQPKGWIDVPLDHVGGGPDGKTLRCFLVQVRIMENHQNGKDTHVRGLKIYARDERVRDGLGGLELIGGRTKSRAKEKIISEKPSGGERAWLLEPDWMGEPELR